MKKYFMVLLSLVILSSCADKQKEFSTVKKGMTREEVVTLVGEPTSKRDILVAEVWKYEPANRTVVFRNGNVYDIMITTDARVDSIEATLKEAGRDIKETFKKTGDTIDSAGSRLKDKMDVDSTRDNSSF